MRWLAEMPRRRAVLDELGRLSDHELADIGLTRGDLPRVFDPSFTVQPQPPPPRRLLRRDGGPDGHVRARSRPAL